uniref:Putative secreted protein n=1 Tax=Anopheles marajoara TaxID=58244 RepID=A0A2M4CA90_9DIPT
MFTAVCVCVCVCSCVCVLERGERSMMIVWCPTGASGKPYVILNVAAAAAAAPVAGDLYGSWGGLLHVSCVVCRHRGLRRARTAHTCV